MRIAVLGGGGFRVPLLHRALVAADLGIDEIALHDVDPGRLAVVSAVLGDPLVRATSSLDDALDGADLVFSAVRVGGVDGRVRDERAALELGVLGQETVGAGGLAYAMRGAPVALEHARRIALRAPSAWTITMTNPAGVITEVMSRELGDRVIGVCDSPAGLVSRAARALDLKPDADSAAAGHDVVVDYVGINHLGWLRGLLVDGVDALPRLLGDAALLAGVEEGRLFGADLIGALGALPNEYLYWYYAAHEALDGVRAAGRTRGEHVRAEQARFYAAAVADPSHAAELWQRANDERNRSYFAELRAQPRDEQDVLAGGYEGVAVALAQALHQPGRSARLALNVRNGDTVSALPPDAVVEVPCRVDEAGATPLPLPLGPLTAHQAALIAQVRDCERDAVEAALSGSATKALRAFALHPLVPSLAAARHLSAEALATADAHG
ncbi:6-phospho-beta-glucosidase [uncultured Jatrophihabitans sp.]|uniref:family 4 glycosyl hydrolase n=1 Tax=uncultured Jatrophihabitans sp. TaxID=1610747 RepID=UPI0035C9833C